MTTKKYEYDFKFLPAHRLAELLVGLPEAAVVSVNMVHNLSVLRPCNEGEFHQIAWINFSKEGEILWDTDPAAM